MVQDKPAAGVHTYDVAPEAVNGVLLPLHMVTLALAVTFGKATIVIVTLPVSVHPLASVPVTTYVVVLAGNATGLAQLTQDKPVAGDHVYVTAPDAEMVTPVAAPWQRFWLLAALTFGNPFTITVLMVVSLQPCALVTIRRTLYVPGAA